MVEVRQILPQVHYPAIDAENGYTPDGWYADHPIFEIVIEEKHPRLILDVGSYLGASAVRMARCARSALGDSDFLVIAIDTWLGSVEHFTSPYGIPPYMQDGKFFATFCENMVRAGVAKNVLPFQQTSSNARKILQFHDIFVDLIYLDASHEYEDVLNDITAYWQILKPGGVLIGDDYEDPWFGVIQAADEFAEINKIKLSTHSAGASGTDGFYREEQTKFILRKT